MLLIYLVTISNAADSNETDTEYDKDASSGDKNDISGIQKLYEVIQECLRKIFGVLGVTDTDEKESEEKSSATKTEKKTKYKTKADRKEVSKTSAESAGEK